MDRMLREDRKKNLHNSVLRMERDRESLTEEMLFELSHKRSYRNYSSGEEMGGHQGSRTSI